MASDLRSLQLPKRVSPDILFRRGVSRAIYHATRTHPYPPQTRPGLTKAEFQTQVYAGNWRSDTIMMSMDVLRSNLSQLSNMKEVMIADRYSPFHLEAKLYARSNGTYIIGIARIDLQHAQCLALFEFFFWNVYFKSLSAHIDASHKRLLSSMIPGRFKTLWLISPSNALMNHCSQIMHKPAQTWPPPQPDLHRFPCILGDLWTRLQIRAVAYL